jgi:hypothetical protein
MFVTILSLNEYRTYTKKKKKKKGTKKIPSLVGSPLRISIYFSYSKSYLLYLTNSFFNKISNKFSISLFIFFKYYLVMYFIIIFNPTVFFCSHMRDVSLSLSFFSLTTVSSPSHAFNEYIPILSDYTSSHHSRSLISTFHLDFSLIEYHTTTMGDHSPKISTSQLDFPFL